MLVRKATDSTRKKDTMRIIIMTAIAGALLSYGSATAQTRYEGAWCAEAPIGLGFVSKDCRFKTFEACLPWVTGGNRGFCTQNPNWPGWYAPTAQSTRYRKRSAQ
jgi:hypothetical protein